jgi:hypothetical protein
MSTTTARRTLAAAALGAVAAATLVAASTTGSAAAAQDDRGVAAVRNATEVYRDVAAAEAAGYRRVSGCEQLPGVGAMGIHYLHPELAADGRLVPTRPEVLLYEPTPDGLVLVGVEYFVAEAAVRGGRPAVLGRPLEGPMPGHSPQMPTHYDLHLWVWRDNPAGTSATWNPAVSCAHAS